MRNRLLTWWIVCLCLQLAAQDAWPQPPPSSPQTPDQTRHQAEALIEQLGSERFAVREHATEQLIMLGLSAVPHLERATRSENREIRQRSQLVVSVIHELDFSHRLKMFAQDTVGDKSYGLPGWERFRDMVGNTKTSRTLFLQMQKVERDLLGAESQPAEDATRIFQRRCRRLRFSVSAFSNRHELPPIAAAVFLASNPNIALDESANMSLIVLCHQLSFENGIKSDSHRPILRTMLAAWILRKDAVPAHDLMMLALQHKISQSLPRARVLTKKPAEVDKFDLRAGILCLAKFGGIDDIPRLEAIMGDKRVLSRYRNNNLAYTVEVRDLALAALLKLTEKEPSAVGYRRLRFQAPFVFDDYSLGFAQDEDRQVAIAKWRLYRMRQGGG
jgi:hypothetical protein